jgi:hypothetical protein
LFAASGRRMAEGVRWLQMIIPNFSLEICFPKLSILFFFSFYLLLFSLRESFANFFSHLAMDARFWTLGGVIRFCRIHFEHRNLLCKNS